MIVKIVAYLSLIKKLLGEKLKLLGASSLLIPILIPESPSQN